MLREIFRICHRKFRQCVEREKSLTGCTMQFTGGKKQSFTWGRKNEEFIADFLLVTQRVLSEKEYALFRLKFLLGADWRLCCPRLKMDRGTFFHELYKIEALLGRTYREVRPYALFPTDEYFGGTTRDVSAIYPPPNGPRPLRPPVAVEEYECDPEDLPLAA